MYYTYLLQSESDPTKRYVGYTTDIDKRLATHNSGGSKHTAKYRPWKLIAYQAFAEKQTALDFDAI